MNDRVPIVTAMRRKKNILVGQLTSAHLLYDERILHRMACSLLYAGFESYVLGLNGYEGNYHGINLVVIKHGKIKPGMPQHLKRLVQLLKSSKLTPFQFFQLHDPDLLLIAPILKLYGKNIIYDVHDDYEASILSRMHRWPLIGKISSKLWWLFERNICLLFDGIVVADRHLAAKFEKLHPVILGNFPRMDFTPPADTSEEETFNLIYVGGINKGRGIEKVLDAMELLPFEDIRFHVVGECREKALLQRLQSNPRVVCHGWVAWTDLHRYYSRAHLGVALYQPEPCFLYCPGENSVKIIEYMAAGIPVLCSNFPGLITFVENEGYGMTVQPDDPEAIASKIRFMYENPDKRTEFGKNGRLAFENKYNWEKHEHKLIYLYEKILNEKSSITLKAHN